MGVDIKFSQSYFWLNTWVLANIIQLGTQSFCERFVDYRIDPCRRLYDQMVMAARCGVANIAEGTSRHSTSIETEMRLLDVARASIDELQGDFFNYLLRRKAEIWPIGNPNRDAIWLTELDKAQYSNSLLHDAAAHIIDQKKKFDFWLESDSADVVANAMLILCVKINRMLQSQLKANLEVFKTKGGFSENMTAERLDAVRTKVNADDTPVCPKCGAHMIRRMQKRGSGQGREFWGCCNYPKCDGVRHLK